MGVSLGIVIPVVILTMILLVVCGKYIIARKTISQTSTSAVDNPIIMIDTTAATSAPPPYDPQNGIPDNRIAALTTAGPPSYSSLVAEM